MFRKALEKMLIMCMDNHLYQFANKVRIQQKGGPIGLKLNPISHKVKEDPLSHRGGAIMTTGLNKYFLADFWLFLYTYQLCYISGPTMQKELTLASKLWI